MCCFRRGSSRFLGRRRAPRRGLRPALLQIPTSLRELEAPVLVVVTLPEAPGGRDGKAVDAEVKVVRGPERNRPKTFPGIGLGFLLWHSA